MAGKSDIISAVLASAIITEKGQTSLSKLLLNWISSPARRFPALGSDVLLSPEEATVLLEHAYMIGWLNHQSETNARQAQEKAEETITENPPIGDLDVVADLLKQNRSNG